MMFILPVPVLLPVPEDKARVLDPGGEFRTGEGGHRDDVPGIIPILGAVFLLPVEVTDLDKEKSSRFEELGHDPQDPPRVVPGRKVLENADGDDEIDGTRRDGPPPAR